MSGYCLIAPGHPVHDYYHANEYGFRSVTRANCSSGWCWKSTRPG